MFARWGRFVHRRRWFVLAASLVLLAISGAAFTQAGRLSNEGSAKPESVRADDLMTAQLPHETSGSSFSLIFKSGRRQISDPEFRSAVIGALRPLRADSRVTAITTPYDVPAETAVALESTDRKQLLATVSVKDEFAVARGYYPELRAKVHSDTLQVIATGGLAINRDFDTILEADLHRAEVVSIPLSIVLLLVVFGTVVAALLPVGVGGLGVVSGLAGTLLLARLTDVSQYSLNIVTLIGLGVAIDYSLLIVNRFREQLARGDTVGDAVEQSVATAGRAVFFSGITVAIGLAAMLFYRGTFLVSMGLAGTIVVAMAVLYALTFLPALLSLLGPRVNRFRVRRGAPPEGRGAWHALATWVMRRPVFVLVPALAFIVLAGSPFLQLRLANGDTNMLPVRAESRQGYDTLIRDFPGHDQTFFAVVVDYPAGSALAADRIGPLYDYSRSLSHVPDVLRVEGPLELDPALGRADYQRLLTGDRGSLPAPMQQELRRSIGKNIVVFTLVSSQPAQSDAARTLLRHVRNLAPPPGAQVLVTGQTAFDVDFINLIVGDTPRAIAFVMLVTYVVLFLLLGSVFLPLKAVLTNLLSISASFGALVWIFQQGHLSTLLGFAPTSIDPTVPVLLFCIVFGLSMDYEVMLLTRIQEEYRKTGDNAHAVAEGLERSGRLITGAAAIMVCVFLAFGLAEVVLIKAIGLGLAIAVLIDASVVRALIVPAVMRLLGRLNWWAPDPLARLHGWTGLGESSAGHRRPHDTTMPV